ncbi:YoaK family protein [Faecalispora anaeroviscerum]|uniref:YoaK family protein n=1 Tax=Faecalispora anaeroviscerum TaxID=2991836 RepID=UPI0024B910F5|nr:YoaK family protein [Faecalispora anaeroviscerum]
MIKAQQMSESLPLVILLTLSGGFMDAYSYICRGQVFANAQTGNILLFGVNLSMGHFSLAWQYLFPVLSFSFGIAIAEIIKKCFTNARRFHWRQAVLMTEAILLFVVAFMPQNLNLFANGLISFVCGAQVESFRKVNGNGVATTMCIGNLRVAVQNISNYGLTKNEAEKKTGFLYLGIIGIFVIGAVIGSLCVNIWCEKAIIVSSIFLLIGFTIMFINKET